MSERSSREVKVEKLPKATIKLNIKVPNVKVKDVFEHVLSEFAKNTEVEGFRKGKAPLNLVEAKIKESDLNGEVINHLLQEYYVAALKEHLITPIGNPKVLIKEFGKDKDFEFEATIAVKPEIMLGDYRKKIKDMVKLKSLEKPEEKYKLKVEDIISAISDSAELEISEILTEGEVNRMLSRLLSQAETLGLSIDQYLSAQNKTADALRKEYEEIALKNLRAEFALVKAIEDEQITIEDKEIEDAINAIGDEKTKETLQNSKDRWYITSVLAKNKLINKLVKEFTT